MRPLAYNLSAGELGPSGRRAPPFTFRYSFLDRPSPDATAAAKLLVDDFRDCLKMVDLKRDWASVDAAARSLLRSLFDGAGRSPVSPEKEGYINVSAQPALTEALSSFVNHRGATVGQSVAAVAWAREGKQPLVFDARGNKAAAPYQPRQIAAAAADAAAAVVAAAPVSAAGAAADAADAAAAAAGTAAAASSGGGAATAGTCIREESLDCQGGAGYDGYSDG